MRGQHANKPHEHRGLVKPFKGAPPELKLSAADQKVLASGKPLRKRLAQTDSGGRGVAVQDIAASPDVVMGRILDFKNYPNMVDKVKVTQNYEVKNGTKKPTLSSVISPLSWSTSSTTSSTSKSVTLPGRWITTETVIWLTPSVSGWPKNTPPNRVGRAAVLFRQKFDCHRGCRLCRGLFCRKRFGKRHGLGQAESEKRK